MFYDRTPRKYKFDSPNLLPLGDQYRRFQKCSLFKAAAFSLHVKFQSTDKIVACTTQRISRHPVPTLIRLIRLTDN